MYVFVQLRGLFSNIHHSWNDYILIFVKGVSKNDYEVPSYFHFTKLPTLYLPSYENSGWMESPQ